MGDLFHDDVPDEFIRKAFQTMGDASQHTFIILTKRPERMRKIISGFLNEKDFATLTGSTEPPFPWPNVWLGVSVENQSTSDERIPLLLQTPAAVRFISVEPLLGPIDLKLGPFPPCSHKGCYNHITHSCEGCGRRQGKLPIDWVIVGGESGPGARPMHPDWVRSLRDQAADVPFFFKQYGEWAPVEILTQKDLRTGIKSGVLRYVDINGNIASHSMSHDCLMERVGKKKAGRELDGRMWNEMPEIGGCHT
jgi:protein gp37